MQKFFVLLAIIITGVVLYDKGIIGWDKRELLSSHQTIAVYQGKTDLRCLDGRTALCPKRCNHTGEGASFAIVDYVAFNKSHPKGDPKLNIFQFVTKGLDGTLKVRPQYNQQVEYLNVGDSVYLNFDHYFISTKEGNVYPRRVLMKLEKM